MSISSHNIIQSFLDNLPEQFKNKDNIKILIEALAEELEELNVAFTQLETLRSLETAKGKQLDGIGEIVVLSRAEAATYTKALDFNILRDEQYRLLLKFKALRNANFCTYPELMRACELLYKPTLMYYKEFNRHPAHFQLMLAANWQDTMISILKSTKLTLKPGGVSIELRFFDPLFFGFIDLNKNAKGFGLAPFIRFIGEE